MIEQNKKKIVHIDMDGVVADFFGFVDNLHPGVFNGKEFPEWEARSAKVEELCKNNPNVFFHLNVIEGAVESVKKLAEMYDIYFLSTPMWCVPHSFTDKRLWLEKHFGSIIEKRLILTHRKDLAIGDYLIDDTKNNGVDKFTGVHIHFGTEQFPDWETILMYFTGVYFYDNPELM